MRNKASEQFIFKVGASPVATFTMDTTDVAMAVAHGLSRGDCVQLTTETTLPAGLSTATNYYVINVTTDTFGLAASIDGVAITTTDAGTGAHSFVLKGHQLLVEDFKNIEIGFFSDNDANLTVKLQYSNQVDVDFNAAQSATNRWDYVQQKDLEDNGTYDGDTGIVLTGLDDNRIFELNTNGQYWVCAQITSYTVGNINLTATCYSD